ncbi:cytochrome c peroxidase, mitochondrial [Cladophialophora bantiana CBS 173.52]|uniref:Peroxidase n=1 Tax=Cladophialophora bantiana (strain ATCC 10958 / CBS 173.52 / CDC B-1940 / NIH 8579) TaxID=1442370 RepID=A0A0D2HV36_CLAB1|nr:cytochrome c peroxidase, mitochondrial [Cladophialophora bantiana CBS 173.52]KIW94735.1 cytochrome c peroxidase, mitochondrial [Cladophialophora bantiana CBS 173.52]
MASATSVRTFMKVVSRNTVSPAWSLRIATRPASKSLARPAFQRCSRRHYSSQPPRQANNIGTMGLIAAIAVLAGGGYYFKTQVAERQTKPKVVGQPPASSSRLRKITKRCTMLLQKLFGTTTSMTTGHMGLFYFGCRGTHPDLTMPQPELGEAMEPSCDSLQKASPVSVDHLLGSLDSRGCLRSSGNARPNCPVAAWSTRPRRLYCSPEGRLPDGEKDQHHVHAVFSRMGFNDQETVALIGAHAVGRCHPDRSGFDGPWTFSSTVFTNEYFRLLMEEKWGWRNWKGPKQYQDQTSKSLVMLPTDMSLKQDPKFRKYVEIYAKDADKFSNDFSAAYCKLLELGVPFDSRPEDRITFKLTIES